MRNMLKLMMTLAAALGISASTLQAQVAPPPPAPLSIVVTLVNNVSCFGGANGKAYVTATGGSGIYLYQWSDGSTTDTLFNAVAGIYSVTVTSGTTATDNAVISEPPQLFITTSYVAPTSASVCDGSGTVVASGGTPVYTYQWDILGTAPAVIQGLCAGIYSLTVTDANGCHVYDSTRLLAPLGANVLKTDVQCHSICNGRIDASPSGGLLPYTHSWSNGSTLDSISGLCAGIYSDTIRDNTGNIYVTTDTIINPDSITINIAVINPLSCSGTCDGKLVAIVRGGRPYVPTGAGGPIFNGPYTYQWQNVATGNDSTNNGLCAGSYGFTVVDASLCTATSRFNLSSNCDVWPGDANSDLVANNYDVLTIAQGYGDTGPVRTGASLTWVGQPATDWANALPNGTNEKYADCDGDGTVNANDTLAVAQNYGLIHLKTENEGSQVDPPLYIAFPPHDSVQAGQTVQVPVYLGDSTHTVASIAGIAFSLNYDTTLVKDNTMQLSVGSSWLGTPGVNLLTFRKDLYASAKTDITIARTNHTNVGGSGAICVVTYVMKDDISGKTDLAKALSMTLSNVKAVLADGTNVPLYSGEADTITVVQTGIDNLAKPMQMNVYPNPAGQYIVADPGTHHVDQYIITDLLGRNLAMITGSNGPTRMSISNLSPGMYLLRAQTGKEISMTRFSVER